MDNPELILQSLEHFPQLKDENEYSIPIELEEYIHYVAKTGDPVFQWTLVKPLIKEKMIKVISEFYDSNPSNEIPEYPNVDKFNYEIMKSTLLERMDWFKGAPFTIQRISELLSNPTKEYNRVDKYMRALEKNIYVVSIREPGMPQPIEETNTFEESFILNGNDFELKQDNEVDPKLIESNQECLSDNVEVDITNNTPNEANELSDRNLSENENIELNVHDEINEGEIENKEEIKSGGQIRKLEDGELENDAKRFKSDSINETHEENVQNEYENQNREDSREDNISNDMNLEEENETNVIENVKESEEQDQQEERDDNSKEIEMELEDTINNKIQSFENNDHSLNISSDNDSMTISQESISSTDEIINKSGEQNDMVSESSDMDLSDGVNPIIETNTKEEENVCDEGEEEDDDVDMKIEQNENDKITDQLETEIINTSETKPEQIINSINIVNEETLPQETNESSIPIVENKSEIDNNIEQSLSNTNIENENTPTIETNNDLEENIENKSNESEINENISDIVDNDKMNEENSLLEDNIEDEQTKHMEDIVDDHTEDVTNINETIDTETDVTDNIETETNVAEVEEASDEQIDDENIVNQIDEVIDTVDEIIDTPIVTDTIEKKEEIEQTEVKDIEQTVTDTLDDEQTDDLLNDGDNDDAVVDNTSEIEEAILEEDDYDQADDQSSNIDPLASEPLDDINETLNEGDDNSDENKDVDEIATEVDADADIVDEERINEGEPETSVLFVSISFIVLMIISLAWLIFYYVQRFRYIHAKDRLSRRLCSAAKKALSKIPTKHIKGEDKEMSGDGECCAICIEFYKASDIVRILPCKHEYHKSCIDPWLLEHRTCPMCKMDILKHYGFVFTGSQESILHLDADEIIFDSGSFPSNLSPIRTSTIIPVIHSSRMISEESRAGSPNELTPALPSSSAAPVIISVHGPTSRAHSSIGTSPSTDFILNGKYNHHSQIRRSLSMDHIFELQSNTNRV